MGYARSRLFEALEAHSVPLCVENDVVEFDVTMDYGVVVEVRDRA